MSNFLFIRENCLLLGLFTEGESLQFQLYPGKDSYVNKSTLQWNFRCGVENTGRSRSPLARITRVLIKCYIRSRVGSGAGRVAINIIYRHLNRPAASTYITFRSISMMDRKWAERKVDDDEKASFSLGYICVYIVNRDSLNDVFKLTCSQKISFFSLYRI